MMTQIYVTPLLFIGKTGNDSFSLRVTGSQPVKQYYAGDLQCFPDFGTLLLINICEILKNISPVLYWQKVVQAIILSFSKHRQ